MANSYNPKNPHRFREDDRTYLIHLIMDVCADGVVIVDPEGKIIYTNVANNNMSGYSEEELMGEPFWKLVVSEDRMKIESFVNKMADRQPRLEVMEVEYLRRDGERLPVEIQLNHVWDNGKLIGVIANIRDITYRRKVTAERDRLLRKTQDQLKQIQILSDAALTLHNEDFKESLRSILKIVLSFVKSEIGWIVIRENQDSPFRLIVQQGLSDLMSERGIKKLFQDQCPCWEKIFNRELTTVGDVVKCERAEKCEYLKDIVKVHYSIPVRIGPNISAIISLVSHDWEHFSDNDIETLNKISGQLAMAVANQVVLNQRLQAQKELEQSEKRYRELIESAPVSITVHQDGKWVMLNKATVEMLGYDSEDELIGKTVWEVIHPDSRKAAMDRFREIIQTGKSFPYTERKVLKKDGSVIYVLVSARPTTYQGRIAIQTISVEITERKKAVEALAASERKYRRLIEQMREGLVITDENGIITLANPWMYKLFGSDRPEDIIGRSFHDFLSGDNRTLIEEKIERRKKGISEEYELKVERENGRPLILGISASPLVDENGNYLGSLTICADLTEKKEQQKLEASLYALSRAVHTTESLDDLYPAIHEIIKGLMPARNFYLAFYDAEKNRIYWPYIQDETLNKESVHPRKPGKGLTEFVLNTGKSQYLSRAEIKELIKEGTIVQYGAVPNQWLGVPLIVADQTIGALVVQTYSEEIKLTPGQLKILEFVSSEVAQTICRKRAEEELEQLVENYRSLFESTTDAIFIHDNQGRFLDVNRAVIEMYGYMREELLGKGPEMLTDETRVDPSLAKEYLNRALDGEVVRFEWWGKRKNGECFPKDVILTKSTYNGKEAVIASARDISEKKQAAQELEQRLQELERFQSLTIGRELRMIELKKRIKELEEQIVSKGP